MTHGKEEFISLVKPKAVFKLHEKTENNPWYVLSCLFLFSSPEDQCRRDNILVGGGMEFT